MRPLLWLGLAAATLVRPATAQKAEIQAYWGSAASLPLPISIVQRGQPDLDFTARWTTRPARAAIYYAFRFGLWSGNRGWRLDYTHHKIYLENPPPEVQEFRITNGFNILTISRAYRSNRLTYGFGAGPVFTYPYNRVRGRELDQDRGLAGYLLSGGSVMGTVSRDIPLAGGLVLNLDVRASASYARVPVVDGHASVPNAALHFHGGLGYLFGKRR
jgi:hypothetical protein